MIKLLKFIFCMLTINNMTLINNCFIRNIDTW